MLQTNAVFPGTLDLLKRLMQLESLKKTYLVGGTALALQIGHRLSIDLDLFSDELPDKQEFLNELGIEVEQISSQSYYYALMIEGVKVDILKFPYGLTMPMLILDNIRMASLEDIAAMKIISISNRGAKKDFIDLSFLLDRFTLSQIFQVYVQKTGRDLPFYVLRGLSFFDDAEEDVTPTMLIPRSWESVKESIINAIHKYYEDGNPAS